ncbi:ROK family protein [Corallincola platygyrae]|uniref:ROK family protein n=1 Tax=Corallincola platygyrae TaxID=1193278 RepID=A0ABW4XMA3_9GAMM
MKGKIRLGIDLGGTKTEIVALSDDGRILLRERTSTSRGDYKATLEGICQLVKAAEHQLGQEGTVGVGIPGTVSARTGLVKNANSTWLIGQPLQQDLSERLEREVRVRNDADCFACSEAIDGAGKGFNSVFGVILGTGVGAGVWVNQQLLPTPNGVAGEWGHNPLPWISDKEREAVGPCYCGKQGCAEQFLSGPGLSQMLFRANKRHLPTNELAQHIGQDSDVTAVFDNYLEYLAKGLAQVINLLDPEVIVLGGGVSNIPQIYDNLPDRLSAYVFGGECATPVLKNVHGDSSGVRGAAWLWNDER